ncbi:hypothetical protein [Aurantivibrio infirmus]
MSPITPITFRKLRPQETEALSAANDVNLPSSANMPARLKQLASIICHLRDEMHRENPKIAVPTRWMIHALLYNVIDECDANDDDWHKQVVEVLQRIKKSCQDSFKNPSNFLQVDGEKPLFPNHELFDEWDSYRFCQAILTYISEQ